MRRLRRELGDTQQRFAHRMKMAISTIVRYESTRPPRGEVNDQFHKLARSNGLFELASAFKRARLSARLSGIPLTIEENIWCHALLDLMRNRRLPGIEKECEALYRSLANAYSDFAKQAEAGARILGVKREEVNHQELELRALGSGKKE